MDCPRCKNELTLEIVRTVNGDVELDKCNSCNGIWFDIGELSLFDKIIEPTIIEFRHIPNRKQQMETLYCPKCEDSKKLIKASHRRDKKVIIDCCQNCGGIWLDYGELEAIQKENFLKTTKKIWHWLIGKE